MTRRTPHNYCYYYCNYVCMLHTYIYNSAKNREYESEALVKLLLLLQLTRPAVSLILVSHYDVLTIIITRTSAVCLIVFIYNMCRCGVV